MATNDQVVLRTIDAEKILDLDLFGINLPKTKTTWGEFGKDLTWPLFKIDTWGRYL